MLILDKVDFRAKKITRDRKEHYIIIKGLMHQKDISILSVYTSNNSTSKYVKQKLIELRREIDKSTIIVGDLNSPLSIIDRMIKHKISKGLGELSNTIV